MSQQFSCARGHRWEELDDGAVSTHTACPVCGSETLRFATSLDLSGETLAPLAEPSAAPPASTDLHSETLPPPPQTFNEQVTRYDEGADAARPADLPATECVSGMHDQATLAPKPAAPTDPPVSPEFAETLPPPDQRGADPASDLAETRSHIDMAALQAPTASFLLDGTQRKRFSPTHGYTGSRTEPIGPDAPSQLDIPGYIVLSELGRGGMGVVYKARDVKLNRIVALKMIISGEHAGAHEMARFHTEAQAVAKLDHPNIVRVYETSEINGRPYFALEFVSGGALDKKIAGHPLPPREAAEIVRKLALAMQYAHDRNIIHRDLKPPNILLTPEGDPKITDFGLAKKLDDDDGRTQSGAIMGTPSYMAPEQAEGRTKEIGPQSDTYSLGAILYELLAGRPPFKGATIFDTLEQVRSQEPVPLQRLQPKVPRDLEVVCFKCLEKDVRKRYVNAAAFAADLGRYLDGEPILARPTPAWERAWKWSRRRPAVAALIAVSAVVIVGLIAGGFLYAGQQRQARQQEQALREAAERNEKKAVAQQIRAEKSEKEAIQQRQRAETNFKRAREVVDRLTTVAHKRLVNVPHLEQLRRTLLGQALRFQLEFLSENMNDPSLRLEVGLAYLRAAELEEQLGQDKDAEQSYDKARGYFVDLQAAKPDDPDLQRFLGTTWNDLAILYQKGGRPAEAEAAYDKALALKTALAAKFPDKPEYQRDLGTSLMNRGILRQAQKRLLDAATDYEKASKVFDGLVAAHPLGALNLPPIRRGDPEDNELERMLYKQAQAHAYLQLGQVQFDMVAAGPPTGTTQQEWADRAEKSFARAEKDIRELANRYVDFTAFQQELASCLKARAGLRMYTRRPDEAVADLRAAIKIFDRLAQQYPSVADYREYLANTYNDLALQYKSANNPREAEKVWRESVPLVQSLVEDFKAKKDPAWRLRLCRAQDELAISLARQNNAADAEKAFETAVKTGRALIVDYPKDPAVWDALIESQTNLTGLMMSIAHADKAEKNARKLVELQQQRLKALPETAPNLLGLARAEKMLADVQLALKQNADARKSLENALQAARQALKLAPTTPGLGDVLFVATLPLAEVLLEQGNHAEAAKAVLDLVTVVAPKRNGRNVLSPERAAAYLTRCMPLVEKDETMNPEKRAEAKKKYADAAMSWLHKAIEQGYDRRVLKDAVEFEPLRGRDDFKKLVEQQ